jgi:hypothetical protein
MPYQLRHRPHVTNAELTTSSTASSSTLGSSGSSSNARKGSREEHEADNFTLKRAETKRYKKSCKLPDKGISGIRLQSCRSINL